MIVSKIVLLFQNAVKCLIFCFPKIKPNGQVLAQCGISERFTVRLPQSLLGAKMLSFSNSARIALIHCYLFLFIKHIGINLINLYSFV